MVGCDSCKAIEMGWSRRQGQRDRSVAQQPAQDRSGVRVWMDNGCMMSPLDLVKLAALMSRTRGRPEVRIGLIDGPVAPGHPDLAASNIQEVPGRLRGYCAQVGSAACAHGTFVAGILCGKRGSAAPAICPGCTLL